MATFVEKKQEIQETIKSEKKQLEEQMQKLEEEKKALNKRIQKLEEDLAKEQSVQQNVLPCSACMCTFHSGCRCHIIKEVYIHALPNHP